MENEDCKKSEIQKDDSIIEEMAVLYACGKSLCSYVESINSECCMAFQVQYDRVSQLLGI